MKYLVFSFDDARLDTYTRAIPIMNKYSIKGVINVISDFVNNSEQYSSVIEPPKAMTKDMVLMAQRMGYEIACHGNTHKNTMEDILDNIHELNKWGIDTKDIGFASPFSYITKENISQIEPLIKNGIIKYVRSGVQTKREGIYYIFLYLLQYLTGNKKLFARINKSHIFTKGDDCKYVRGISITKNTTVEQLVYFLEHMPDKSVVIFIFHSILKKTDVQHKKDKWYWDTQKFERFCKYVSEHNNLMVLTHKKVIGGK